MYQSFYGFKEMPFNITPDPRFLYLSPTHLEALQHLVNQVFGRSLAGGERLVCDVHGFRATREAELQTMANFAANRVRQTGVAFTFEPMSANERRIIHLTLADSPDLSTESIGEGAERKLRISPKSAARRS